MKSFIAAGRSTSRGAAAALLDAVPKTEQVSAAVPLATSTTSRTTSSSSVRGSPVHHAPEGGKRASIRFAVECGSGAGR